MKTIIKLLSAIAVGLGLGLLVALKIFSEVQDNNSIAIGQWQHNPLVGSEEATGLARTTVAIIGFLGLSQQESIYFLAKKSDDQRLSGKCSYSVSGFIPQEYARWWSITVYNAENYKLIRNEENRYSFSKDTVELNEDGRFTIYVGASEAPDNWIPVREDATFDLLLRLYNPSQNVLANREQLALPVITRETCV